MCHAFRALFFGRGNVRRFDERGHNWGDVWIDLFGDYYAEGVMRYEMLFWRSAKRGSHVVKGSIEESENGEVLLWYHRVLSRRVR